MSTDLPPLLKWPGGKAKLASRIAAALGPVEGRYLEPFVGSGSVALHLLASGLVEPRSVIVADANPRLVALHRAVRDEPFRVIRELRTLPLDPADDWKARYNALRAEFNTRRPQSGVRHAALFLWLNRAGFNGLYRENRSGALNTPPGQNVAIRVPDPRAILRVSQALRGVRIWHADYRRTIGQARRGDVVYCDPPYAPLAAAMSNFSAYAAGGFGTVEHLALRQSLVEAAGRGAVAVVSNVWTPRVRHSFLCAQAGFDPVDVFDVTRSIAASGAARGRVAEVLARIGATRGELETYA